MIIKLLYFSLILFSYLLKAAPVVEKAKITGYVFQDFNKDKSFNPHEYGIMGVLVTLKDTNGKLTPITFVTNNSGYYEFKVSVEAFNKDNPLKFEVDEKTLPTGTEVLKAPNNIIEPGKFNISVSYPLELFDTGKIFEEQDFKIILSDETKSQPSLNDFITEEKIEILKPYSENGIVKIKYTGILDKKYKFKINNFNIFPELSQKFTIIVPLVYGVTNFLYEFEDEKETVTFFNRKISFSKKDGVKKKVFLLAVPDKIKSYYKEGKKEFLYLTVEGGSLVFLNGNEVKTKGGHAGFLYEFDYGVNTLRFNVVSKNKKTERSDITVIISRDGKDAMYLGADLNYIMGSTSATEDTKKLRDYSGANANIRLYGGIKPFVVWKKTRDNKFLLKNLAFEAYFERSKIKHSATDSEGETKTVTATPTTYGLSVHQMFYHIKYFKVGAAPKVTYERYNFNIQKNKLFRNASYDALKIGFVLSYWLTWIKSDLLFAFNYSPYFNYKETPPIGGYSIKSARNYDLGLGLSRKLTNNIDALVKFKMQNTSVTYENKETAKDSYKTFSFGLKYQF